jgi:hypothetical protein
MATNPNDSRGGPLNRLLAGLGLDDKLPPIPSPQPITTAVRMPTLPRNVVAERLDAIDPDWPNKFQSTDAAARFYRAELEQISRSSAAMTAAVQRSGTGASGSVEEA